MNRRIRPPSARDAVRRAAQAIRRRIEREDRLRDIKRRDRYTRADHESVGLAESLERAVADRHWLIGEIAKLTKELSTAQQMIIRYRDTETMRARIDSEEDRHV